MVSRNLTLAIALVLTACTPNDGPARGENLSQLDETERAQAIAVATRFEKAMLEGDLAEAASLVTPDFAPRGTIAETIEYEYLAAIGGENLELELVGEPELDRGRVRFEFKGSSPEIVVEGFHFVSMARVGQEWLVASWEGRFTRRRGHPSPAPST